jgi:small-conductance mechanosensitive channel
MRDGPIRCAKVQWGRARQRRIVFAVSRRHLTLSIVAALSCGVAALSCGVAAAAQDTAVRPTAPFEETAAQPSAPVVVDGVELFRVRGVRAFPATERAVRISQAIRAFGSDRSIPVDSIAVRRTALGAMMVAGRRELFGLVDADAEFEGLSLPILAEVVRRRVAEAVIVYRRDREPAVLWRHVANALVATVAFALFLTLGRRAFRRFRAMVDRRYRSRVHDVQIRTVEVVRGEQVWLVVHHALRLSAVLIALVAAYAYINYVLVQFPWTRGVGRNLSAMLMRPLATLGAGLVAFIPDLIFLVVITLLARFAIRFSRVFFRRVGGGQITLEGFDADWAQPTERIVRFAIVVFALIIAYPYIPGSGSEAFKGIGLILGLMFSLGSPSVIGNLVAGLSLAFRRAFHVGDRVKIGDHVGYVSQVRLLTTYLRSIKNEEIVIPNSLILNSEVINFTTLALDRGLILHTTVGIGYETPWRQVEAMLLEAARRTPGLQAEPRPYVLQKKLGDFAVEYEINGYCNDTNVVGTIYTNLHGNILDVFNEHSVQIMTPAYEGDPEQPKVVPREQWYAAPARPGEVERVVEGAATTTPADVSLASRGDRAIRPDR